VRLLIIPDLCAIVVEDFTEPKKKKIKVATELWRLNIAFISLDFAPYVAIFNIAFAVQLRKFDKISC
jgi:hypothetical protein